MGAVRDGCTVREQIARGAHGTDRSAVDVAAGLSRWAIQEIEAGRRDPTLDTLLRIARALEVPLADPVR
ncbi:helix-turn-helix transcriptional regulator [Streptomyces sp. NPDC048254]|uniref:helix-turn-helix transcriptional regulator n=1 Tax=Streptomyces sp. NPDC048254 TaxID=3365525 RepID=UPI0037138A20